MKTTRPHLGPRFALLFCCLAALLCPGRQARAAVSIVDDAGATISLAAPARRVVPLYAGLGEILAALGMADRVVGRTASDDSLPERLPVVGTHMRPNQEIIIALAPDLALQFEGREEAGLAAESLSRLGIPVARFRITSFAGLFSCITRLGVLCGKEKEAAALAASMQSRLDKVRRDMAWYGVRPKVFFEVRYPNLLGAGKGSLLTDIIDAAGGENCLAGHAERMVRLSEEALILFDPDIYLVQEGPMNKAVIHPKERAHFRGLAAVRRGFVRIVPEARYSRPGPRAVDAAEELAILIRAWQKAQGRPEKAATTSRPSG